MPERAGSGSETGLSPVRPDILLPGFDPHFGHISSADANLHQVSAFFGDFWHPLTPERRTRINPQRRLRVCDIPNSDK